jgi:hypothetical protein
MVKWGWLVGAICAVVLGWMLFVHRAPPAAPVPTLVDTVLQESPAAAARIDSLLRTVDSLKADDKKKDVEIRHHKARADQLAAQIASHPAPTTLAGCTQDLAARTEEAQELRSALTPCEASRTTSAATIARLQGIVTQQQHFRGDTLPRLLQIEREAPRPCREDWGLFHVKCSTAGYVKFFGGLALGVAATR